MTPPRAQVECDLQMTGVLLQDGQARMRQLDSEGHLVPVLCLAVELECATRGRATVEQPFPAGHDRQCEAAARRFKRGMRVTFDAPTVGIQLLVRNARHVHLHTVAEEAQAGA